jgi:hypothetical protein
LSPDGGRTAFDPRLLDFSEMTLLGFSTPFLDFIERN